MLINIKSEKEILLICKFVKEKDIKVRADSPDKKNLFFVVKIIEEEI